MHILYESDSLKIIQPIHQMLSVVESINNLPLNITMFSLLFWTFAIWRILRVDYRICMGSGWI